MTAEQLEKIRWLNRAICAQEDLDKMKQKHEQEKSHAERTTRGAGGGTPTYGNSTENAFVKAADTSIEIEQTKRYLGLVRAEITSAINKLNNPKERELLERRYLKYQTWRTIARKMNYSKSAVQYRHKKVLNKIDTP